MSPRSRTALLWLAFPFVIAAGAAAGYLAADRAAPAPPAATAVAGHDHDVASHPDTGDVGHPVDGHASDAHATGGHGGTSAGEHQDATDGHGPARAVAAPTGAGRMLTLSVFGAANVVILLAAAVLRRSVRHRGHSARRPATV